MITSPLLLQVEQVSKSFPGVQALDRVALTLRSGEVLAVVGENGAGKSTLMKILGGICTPESGTIFLDGVPVRITDVNEAMRQGISLIHQELNLAENLSITANLFLGREWLYGRPFGFLRHGDMRDEARRLLARVGLTTAPDTPVYRLSPGQRQMVEIARALSMQVRILIMDEPTSSLTQRETEQLYKVIDDLRQAGVAILYISHRLAEVQRVADRVMVLRDGRNAGELIHPNRQQERPELAAISHEAMVRLMVGREPGQFFQHQHRPRSEQVRLELRELRCTGVPSTLSGLSEPISFTLHSGEILGLAGLVGAGRTELAETIFGLRRLAAGQIWLDGRPVHFRQPWQAIAAGVLLVPEDRRYHGLILADSIQSNLGLPNLDSLQFLHLVAWSRERQLAETAKEQLRIRTPHVRKAVGLLSGGNQQKVVLGKWLAHQPRVLLVDEPTRGVDVGAKSEIYTLLDQLARQGVAILMISSDLEEILGMSDRVAVLHEGRLTGILNRAELSEEAVMHLATGRHAQS